MSRIPLRVRNCNWRGRLPAACAAGSSRPCSAESSLSVRTGVEVLAPVAFVASGTGSGEREFHNADAFAITNSPSVAKAGKGRSSCRGWRRISFFLVMKRVGRMPGEIYGCWSLVVWAALAALYAEQDAQE